jgi:hypothetical protein
VAPGLSREYSAAATLRSGQTVQIATQIRIADLGDAAKSLRGQVRGGEVAE